MRLCGVPRNAVLARVLARALYLCGFQNPRPARVCGVVEKPYFMRVLSENIIFDIFLKKEKVAKIYHK